MQKYRDRYNDGDAAVRQARHKRMAEMGLINPKTAQLPPTVGQGAWGKFSAEGKRFHAGLFQAHAAMVDRRDQGLGDVCRAIKEAGRWENTLIVFLTDNGASPERYEQPGFDRPTITRDGKPIGYGYNDPDRLAGLEHTFY